MYRIKKLTYVGEDIKFEKNDKSFRPEIANKVENMNNIDSLPFYGGFVFDPDTARS